MTNSPPSEMPLLPVEKLASAIRKHRQHAQLDHKSAASYWNITETSIDHLENELLSDDLSRVLRHVLGDQDLVITSQRYLHPITEHSSQAECHAQKHLITQLLQHPAIFDGKIHEAAQIISKTLAETLHVDTASVWLLDDMRTTLNCTSFYDHEQHTHQHNMPYTRNNYPLLFDALDIMRNTDANRALQLLHAFELPSDLQSFSIPSVYLDSVINVSGKVVGIVSCAHHEGTRHWTIDEVTFHREMADLISKTLINAERHLINDSLKETQQHREQLEQIINHSSLIVFRWKAARGWPIEFVSNNVERLFGYSKTELCSKKITYGDIIHPDDLHRVENVQDTASQNPLDNALEYRIITKEGEVRHVIEHSSTIADSKGKPRQYYGVIQDVTELRTTQEKMERLAFYDPLTGLENRRLFKKRLEQILKVAIRNKTSAALLFLDLDRFKYINDTLGHDAGDALLKTVAERLRGCLREEDTIARLGGDEFTIILPDVEAIGGADIVAQNILNMLGRPIALPNQEVNISASIGITMAPDDSDDINTLLKNADLAMYQAKAQGRNTYRFFVDSMNAAAEERMFMQNGLRYAFEHNEFTLFFQPQINLHTRKITSMEALIRWNHPHRGMIAPNDFIPIAEDTGLIIPIGQWVLEEACKKARDIQLSGSEPIKVCVNLSTLQFRDKNLVNAVAGILKSTGLNPAWLELEITESMLMGDVEEAINTLHELKAVGVSLSIDDFGTGYSSLNYLKRLPIDIVKVDQSFVREIPENLSDMEITSAVISMAHNLQLKVIAEGVETEDQQDFLNIAKCDYAQGYYFSRPIPSDRVLAIIEQHNAQHVTMAIAATE